MTRLLDEMAETKYRIAELTRGYQSDVEKARVELYAERNGELHVLCHEMLNALEYLGCEPDILHAFRQRLHNVPQCRKP